VNNTLIPMWTEKSELVNGIHVSEHILKMRNKIIKAEKKKD